VLISCLFRFRIEFSFKCFFFSMAESFSLSYLSLLSSFALMDGSLRDPSSGFSLGLLFGDDRLNFSSSIPPSFVDYSSQIGTRVFQSTEFSVSIRSSLYLSPLRSVLAHNCQWKSGISPPPAITHPATECLPLFFQAEFCDP